MLGRLAGEEIELVVSPQADPAWVLVDPGHVEQVLVNLAVNASDAMRSGGTLTLATRKAELTEEAAAEFQASPGSYVVLSVGDDGEGMDEEMKEKIFEPFFTTKGGGSGLGLSTVHGIVRQSEGFIRVESEPGNGSVFEVWLPCAGAATEDEGASEGPDGGEVRASTVMLAEDEELVRDLAVTVLERAGYRVLPAASGDQALELCRQTEDEIDVLVADMVMPGMSGRELAECVLVLRPKVRVVLMSGYTEEVPLISMGGVAQPGFLQKPFAPDALVHSVQALFDQRGSPPPGDGRAERKGTITCLVADDHPAVLDAVSRYLEQNGIDVVARASRGDDALKEILALKPSTALLDIRMTPLSGIEVARHASRTAPETQTVLYTGYGDQAMLEQALDAGVRGFVSKEASLTELVRALTAVGAGGTYVDPELAGALASGQVGALSPADSS